MGLFDFLRKNNPVPVPHTNGFQIPSLTATAPVQETLDIPKDLFIEEREPQEFQPQATISNSNGGNNIGGSGIVAIYNFLQADYEVRGYNDALTNPDDSNRIDGIKMIKWDMQILLKKVYNYYEKQIKDFDFHIESRGRAGLIDLVEEIKSEREKAVKDMDELKQIEQHIDPGTGMVERVILSYKKGFMRGLAAITQSKIMKQ